MIGRKAARAGFSPSCIGIGGQCVCLREVQPAFGMLRLRSFVARLQRLAVVRCGPLVRLNASRYRYCDGSLILQDWLLGGAMRICFGAVILVCALFISDRAAAWGDLGHQIVCQIAFEELPAPAKRAVRALMAHDAQFKSFSKGCVFPDWPRIRDTEHYVDLPRNAAEVDAAKPCGPKKACVITAIINDMRDFSRNDGAAGRLLLLKTLGHWVGDIHQPLHVSFDDDHGGNWVKVTGE